MSIDEAGNRQARVAMTGRYGYVGSVLAAALGPNPVVGLCRKPQQEHDVPWTFQSSGDAASALRAEAVETLIHAAWDMRSVSAEEVERVCVRGSEKLFDAAERAGVKRLIFISSMSAFERCRSVYGQMKLRVEQMVRERGGMIVRPGLVFGPDAGGAFGNLYAQVGQRPFVPVLNTGRELQYLLAAETLGEVMRRMVAGDMDGLGGRPLTLAYPEPLSFRQLVFTIAAFKKQKATIIPVPWWSVWGALRSAEAFGLRLTFRSDSVLGAVYPDPNPDFSTMKSYGIEPLAIPDGLVAKPLPSKAGA